MRPGAGLRERGEKQSGAAGWIAGRAPQWLLDCPDWRLIERQKYLWNPLMDYWFRMDMVLSKSITALATPAPRYPQVLA